MNMEWIDNVLRDVAELPDRNSPEDWPEAMLVTGAELRQIIVANAPAEPVNARLLEALKRLSFCAQTTGGVAGRDDELRSAIEASAKAIAAAEAQQERLLQDMQVRADEREACAKVCDELFPPPGEKMAVEWAAGTIACANTIRARGQK